MTSKVQTGGGSTEGQEEGGGEGEVTGDVVEGEEGGGVVEEEGEVGVVTATSVRGVVGADIETLTIEDSYLTIRTLRHRRTVLPEQWEEVITQRGRSLNPSDRADRANVQVKTGEGAGVVGGATVTSLLRPLAREVGRNLLRRASSFHIRHQ